MSIENIDFQAIDPQANGPQLFYGFRYHLHITTEEEGITFHEQVAYWLWEPATGLILQTLAIPRGEIALASGQAKPETDETSFQQARRNRVRDLLDGVPGTVVPDRWLLVPLPCKSRGGFREANRPQIAHAAGVGLAPQYRRVQLEAHVRNGLVDLGIADRADDPAHPVPDPPALRRAHQRVVVPAGAIPQRAALGSVSYQPPVAVGQRTGRISVDMDEVVRHRMLGVVERIVEHCEVALEAGKVVPVRGRTEIGLDIGREDAVEQLPALGVHRRAIEIDDRDDREPVLFGHDASPMMVCGSIAEPVDGREGGGAPDKRRCRARQGARLLAKRKVPLHLVVVTKESAGILLYRRVRGPLEVLLIHPGGPFWRNRDAGAWQIPKGGIEDGETAAAAAIRECEEELGTVVAGTPWPLARIRQSGGKWVEAYALEQDLDADAVVSNSFEIEWPPRSGGMQSFPEVDRAAWFDLEAARAKMLASQVPLLDRLAEMIGAAQD